VSILKDAAAASIYGARATNGVVVITTKRGKLGKGSINITATYGIQQPWKKLKMLNSRQWMEYRNDLAGTAVFSDAQMNNISIDTNWQDLIFRNGPTSNIEASVSGGNDKTKFFISGNYFTEKGALIGAGYNRLSSRLNLDHNFNDKITLGASLGVTFSKTDRVEGDQSLHGILPNGISTGRRRFD
jgi:TonB-dependent SusC/RagA subfamily outer membrane receptor